MIFYKNLFISVILSALLVLAGLAFVMYKSNSTQVYPPTFNPCPDYYNYDASTNVCTANQQVWTNLPFKGSSKSPTTGLSCDIVNFSSFKSLGLGPSSALCTKSKWSSECGVNWDGISNNPAICYS